MRTTAFSTKEEVQANVLLMARADSCKLLSACFYPPDRQLLSASSLIGDLSNCLRIACATAARQLPTLPEPMGQAESVALAVAYTRLFLGPPSVLAPPHASFYLDDQSGVMGPSTVAMLKQYRERGLDLDSDFPEMPDHIAVVLEFLYFLLFREAALLENGAAEERIAWAKQRAAFVDRYVRPWIPDFCARIVAADEHPFYNDLARCLELFVHGGLEPEILESA